MQTTLDSEARTKVELQRHKKKLEQDVNELEIGLDQANKINADHQLNERRLQQSMHDVQNELDLANQAKVRPTRYILYIQHYN